MDVEISKLGRHLSGRLKGVKDFAHVCDRISAVRPGDIVLLDFKDVQYVSASWINAMLVSLAKRAADNNNDFYLVISSFPGDSLDDLQLVAEQAHIPFLVVKGKTNSKAELIGTLDSVQRETLAVVQEVGEVTGAGLAEKHRKFNTKATAWNNRLRDLFEKRLLRRRKQGREQIYTPLMPEVIING